MPAFLEGLDDEAFGDFAEFSFPGDRGGTDDCFAWRFREGWREAPLDAASPRLSISRAVSGCALPRRSLSSLPPALVVRTGVYYGAERSRRPTMPTTMPLSMTTPLETLSRIINRISETHLIRVSHHFEIEVARNQPDDTIETICCRLSAGDILSRKRGHAPSDQSRSRKIKEEQP
jgi:hypothetical protein